MPIPWRRETTTYGVRRSTLDHKPPFRTPRRMPQKPTRMPQERRTAAREAYPTRLHGCTLLQTKLRAKPLYRNQTRPV